jgi:TetR/AcrR family transcriptional repressor of mexJK operon
LAAWGSGNRNLLQQFADRGKIDDPAIAADLFLSLVLGNTDKLHVIATPPKIQEQRREAAVKLFLNGVRNLARAREVDR